MPDLGLIGIAVLVVGAILAGGGLMSLNDLIRAWPAGLGRMVFTTAVVASITCVFYGAVLLEGWIRRWLGWGPLTTSFEAELDYTMRALEENSQRALTLIGRMQGEVAKRRQALEELRSTLAALQQERSLLELTPDQRAALSAFLQRRSTAREIFTSRDFWLGRVVISAFFFALGLVANAWLRWP